MVDPYTQQPYFIHPKKKSNKVRGTLNKIPETAIEG